MMAAAWALGRSSRRGRAGELVALGALIGLGLGVSVLALEVAARTDRAYERYRRDAEVAELVVNPGFSTARAEEIIATTPAVSGYTTDDFLIATVDDGAPRRQSQVDSVTAQVRMSSDGRYAEQDRPTVVEGRRLGPGREAFLNRQAAEDLGVTVGDTIPLSFWTPSYNTPGVGSGQDDVVQPIGHARARVVGIGVFADEVLEDGLYPRQRILVSPAVAEPFTCTIRGSDPDDGRDVVAIATEIVPPNCALAYRYFSLRLDGGDASVTEVVRSLRKAFDAENRTLPRALRAADIGYIVIPTETRDEHERVDESLRPTVAALRVYGFSAGAATLVVAGLLAMRSARRQAASASVWRQLGATRFQRSIAIALPLGQAAALGLVAAAAISVAASGLGPISSARRIDPGGGLGLEGDVIALAIGGAAALLLLTLVGVSFAAARARPRGSRRHASRLASVARAAGPFRALGVEAAATGPGAVAVLAGSATAIAVVVASVVFSSSLGGLIDAPARYGWPYDAAVVIGFGYGGADEAAIGRSLDRPEVERWGIANLGAVTLRGQTLGGISARKGFDRLPITLIEGVRPTRADEIAIGARSAESLDLGVGDRVNLSGQFGQRKVTVTGIAVMPSIGPYESDRATPGTGVLLSEPLFVDMVADAEKAQDLPPGSFEETGLGSFVAIDLRDDVDRDRFLESIAGERRTWDRNRFDSLAFADPVRPPTIENAASIRGIPVGLGVFFALTMALGLTVAVAVATRGRRRELAVLRALGASGRSLASSVRWHSLTVVAVAAIIGTPLGLAAGGALYRAFARDLGVDPVVVVSAPLIAGILAVAAVLGLLASLAPGRQAARQPAAGALTSE